MAIPTFYTFIIYSNDGSEILAEIINPSATYYVIETGLDYNIYTYSGTKTFLGLATSANATTPTYAIGDSFTTNSDTNLYIVEEETSSSNKKLNIIYQGETLATLNVGDAKLLEVKDFKMEDDLVFEIVEEEDKPLTFTVRTVAHYYTFPLDSSLGVSFYDLNGLYDLTNTVYISCPNKYYTVYLKPDNVILIDSTNTVVSGNSIVYPNDLFNIMAGGSN